LDDYPHGDFFLFAYAERFHHVGISVEYRAYLNLHAVGGYFVWFNVDNLIGFCLDGYVWEESSFYCHAEILAEDRAFVCIKIPMENNSNHFCITDYSDIFSNGNN
jgi:hypothetical protein